MELLVGLRARLNWTPSEEAARQLAVAKSLDAKLPDQQWQDLITRYQTDVYHFRPMGQGVARTLPGRASKMVRCFPTPLRAVVAVQPLISPGPRGIW